VPKILIVDDEPAILELLKLNMEMAGHEVYLAGDGETALARVSTVRPAVVLLDVMMPAIDGWGVLEGIRNDPKAKGTKVIIMSAKVGSRDLSRGFDLGADDYLTKPFDVNDVLERVEAVISWTSEDVAARRRELLGGES
jgi:DNA-binding response OmpR family regulator